MSHTKQFISHLSRNKKAVQIKQSFTFKKYLLSLLRELERRNEIWEPWEYGEMSTFVSRHGAGGSLPIILFPNASGIAMTSKSLSTSRRVAVRPRAENVQACPRPSLWLQVVSMNDPPKPKNLHWVFSESSNPHGPGQELQQLMPVLNMYRRVLVQETDAWPPQAKWRNRKKLLCRLGEIRILTLHAPPS